MTKTITYVNPSNPWPDYTESALSQAQAEANEKLGDIRFHAVLDEMGELHDKKQQDYGKANDPFANVRASEDFGIPPWVGSVVRANDKMRRLQTAATRGSLSNESVEDSLLDLAVYAIIGLVLYREEHS